MNIIQVLTDSCMRPVAGACVLLLACAAAAQAQTAETGRLFFDAIPFAGPTADSGRLDLYLVVPYSAISFSRRDGQFEGRYQARIKVVGGGHTWLDSTFIRSVETSSYETTAGRRPVYEFYQQRQMLPPGPYTASVELLDFGKNLTTTEQREIVIPDYAAQPVALSGLMLVRKIREDSTGHLITPMLSESVDPGDDGYFLFFETYNNGSAGEFHIETQHRSDAGPVGAAGSFQRPLPAGRSQQWVRVSSEAMPRGIFTVELRITAAHDTSRTLATARRTVRFDGTAIGIPLAEDELNERITQLRYIATQSEIDNIRNAPTLLDRQRRYAEFWERFDPTPGTPENEAQNEYFRRIEHATAHFRSYAAGWLTDKGRIYVIYGPPDNISTDPFRTDGKAVESWHYYRRNVRLVFADESGFGDFRLTTPISPGEKYRYGG